MTTLQEQLNIIQAAINGKEIEFYIPINKEWRTKNTTINKEFDFIDIKYRIKPKEQELHQYLIYNSHTKQFSVTVGLYPSLENCMETLKSNTHATVIQKLDHTKTIIKELP